MVVNVQIAFTGNIQVNQTMARHLGKHVFKERNAGIQAVFAGTVKIEADGIWVSLVLRVTVTKRPSVETPASAASTVCFSKRAASTAAAFSWSLL